MYRPLIYSDRSPVIYVIVCFKGESAIAYGLAMIPPDGRTSLAHGVRRDTAPARTWHYRSATHACQSPPLTNSA